MQFTNKNLYKDFFHTYNSEIIRGNIIKKLCNVKFIKFILYDLAKYPYIALVYIGVHPSLSPNCTPAGIKDNLQSMILDVIEINDATTACSLLAGNIFFSKVI